MKVPSRGKLVKAVRRVHLYFGLFLVPWVMLYGFTALLFNHPDWMHPRTIDPFGPAILADTRFADPWQRKAPGQRKALKMQSQSCLAAG